MPKMFLIPNSIGEEACGLAGDNARAITGLRVFFVEEPRSARRLLKTLDPHFLISECRFYELNEHTTPAQVKEYVPVIKAHNTGIISESGCPCVADPGADLVLLAHRNNVDVVPLVGPSSILLALMASGLNGQNFAFNGYLPKDKVQRAAKIKALAKRAQTEGQSQIFMETPYRNQNVFEDLLNCVDAKMLLCIAQDLTGKEEFIRTNTIAQWQNAGIPLPKLPALFIIGNHA